MAKIFTRHMCALTGDQSFETTAGAVITGLSYDNGHVFVHTLEDRQGVVCRRRVGIFLENQALPEADLGAYVGQLHMPYGAKVVHVFDRGEQDLEETPAHPDGTRLYRVQLVYEAIVVADSPHHAVTVARESAVEIAKDKDKPDVTVCGRINKLLDLRQCRDAGWDEECLPYGGRGEERNKRIGDYLAEVWK